MDIKNKKVYAFSENEVLKGLKIPIGKIDSVYWSSLHSKLIIEVV